MTKRISDLLDTYSDPNIELQIKTPLSSERIKVLTMKKINEEAAPKKRRITFRVMLTAAIVISLALSVFAVSGGAEWFRSFFEENNDAALSAEQLAYIEQNAVTVGQRQAVDGHTVTLDSYISDGDRTYVKLEIQLAEGIKLPKHGCGFTEIPILTGGKATVTSAEAHPLELDHAAGRASYLLILDGSAKYNEVPDGTEMVLELSGLEEVAGDGQVFTEGVWRFVLPHQDTQKIDLLNAPLEGVPAADSHGNSCSITLTSATLRAMELEVIYEVSDPTVFGSVHCNDIHAVMRDGSVVSLHQVETGEHVDSQTNIRWIEFVPDAPIVLDEVVSIEFPDGTQIPLA